MADDEVDTHDRSNLVSSSGASERFSPGVVTRFQYASYLLLGCVICMLMKGGMGQLFSHIPAIKEGCDYLGRHESQSTLDNFRTYCSDNTLVYRISFSLAIFFLFQYCSVSDLTCCINAADRAKMQESMWCIKSAILFVIQIVCLWIPNSFFAGYAWFAMFVSAIFLIIQILLIVDFSYEWNDDWGDRSERNTKWTWYLMGIAFLSYVFGTVMTIVNFVYFVPKEDCNLNAALITMVLVAMVIYTTVAIWVPHGSVVPSGIVFAYTSMLTFSALHLQEDPTCNSMFTDEKHTSWKIMLLTALFSAAALAYTVISSGGTGSRSSLSLRSDEELQAEDPDETGHLSNYCYFHLIMIMGSMYLAMMVTNWHVSGSSSGNSHGAQVAFWVKNSSIWITITAYLWTLLAPYFCCRDRDYGYDIPDGW